MPREELSYEPGVLRVLQTKAETKSFYKEIYSAGDLNEAEVVWAALRSAGIRCEISGGQQAGLAGLPIMEVKLLVRAEDADRAFAFIERHRRPH